ncbi:valine--tRNA ligase [Candidatus Saccharibacteria bacterium]|nr:valine--tRNA ligase [Candidatus Saccharibacteria bacterium]
MSKKLSKAYEPQNFEPTVYQLWEQGKVFATPKSFSTNKVSAETPEGAKEEQKLSDRQRLSNFQNDHHFSILMPPLNANGNMHIGHSLAVSLQDILCRWKRSNGVPTSYIPGLDHAGLETWVVFERKLNEQGKSRFDYDRDTLYKMTWDFVEEHKSNIELQMRASGIGADWDSQFYTLDANIRDQVYETFHKMWQDGLIYRGERIVNYSTKYQTGYADIEVDYKEEKGFLWDVAYDIKGTDQKIVVSTTRPETILGDTAVAVSPEDSRYRDLIGASAIVPLVGREIPIIADEYADPTYGTGAVKITPAHDPNDFEVGNRHDLPRITVIGYDGLMTPEAGQDFAGLTVEKARQKILKDLENEGRIVEKRKIVHTVGYDYKSGLPIQPLLKEQWFINMRPLAKRAIEVIKSGRIKFYPESKATVLCNYLENLRDWNLSRQIPWGIPIPAYRSEEGEWIFNANTDQAQIEQGGIVYYRDEDVFDTWFSSGQLPICVMPDGYTPISVMETGGDILFPWVSRMIMLSLYMTDEVPFDEVYLHGMVLDEKGQKMSKSKGNVVNPMETVAKYGSDALRMGLVASRSAGQSQAFGTDKVVAGRNLCNKLWNMSRLTINLVGENYIRYDGFATDKERGSGKVALNEPIEHWIVAKCLMTKINIDKLLDEYRFAEAAEVLYGLIWGDVADWFLESEKMYENNDLLAWVLEYVLKLAHPFIPFATEAIWQVLPWTDGILASEKWNEKDFIIARASVAEISTIGFERLQDFIIETRRILNDLPKGKYKLLYGQDELLKTNEKLIQKLSHVHEISFTDAILEGRRKEILPIVVEGREAWLEVPANVKEDYLSGVRTRLSILEQEIAGLERRLINPNYVDKAPKELVKETEKTLSEKKSMAEKLCSYLGEG